jgi:hypothetical protein
LDYITLHANARDASLAELGIESIVYEQCPYDWDHISSIYKNIEDEPTSTEWHTKSVPTGTVRYRRNGDHFQFIFARAPSVLFEEALNLEPMPTDDDAEWIVERHGPNEYLVRTTFTTTFGPVDAQELIDATISKYGLWLENQGNQVSGVATFDALEAEKMWHACRRLVTLEKWCLAANHKVMNVLAEFWGSVHEELLSRIATQNDVVLDSDRTSRKHRAPL